MVFIPPITSNPKEKVLGALDKMRESNINMYMKGGMSREDAERWYDEPGSYVSEYLKPAAIPGQTEEERIIQLDKAKKTTETIANILTPRGIEDVLLAGVTMRGAKAGWR